MSKNSEFSIATTNFDLSVKVIEAAKKSAEEYANNYPNVTDDETRRAIAISHFAYQISEFIRELSNDANVIIARSQFDLVKCDPAPVSAPKTYPAFNSEGEAIRVTIPEN